MTKDDDQASPQAARLPDPLYTLTYVSTSTQVFSQAELLDLLEKARRFNAKCGVTGLLLHKGDAFFQILEGLEAQVQEVYARICADPRHERIETLVEEPARERQFPDWRMGFVDLDKVDPSLLPGYSDFLERDDSPRTIFRRMTNAQRLAYIFRDTN